MLEYENHEAVKYSRQKERGEKGQKMINVRVAPALEADAVFDVL
jgi:hypothetical protein